MLFWNISHCLPLHITLLFIIKDQLKYFCWSTYLTTTQATHNWHHILVIKEHPFQQSFIPVPTHSFPTKHHDPVHGPIYRVVPGFLRGPPSYWESTCSSVVHSLSPKPLGLGSHALHANFSPTGLTFNHPIASCPCHHLALITSFSSSLEL